MSVIETITIPRLMTVREVAATLRCSRSQAYALVYAHTIPSAKVAGKTLCKASDVEAYLARQFETSGSEANADKSSKPSATLMEGESAVLLEQRRNRRLMHS